MRTFGIRVLVGNDASGKDLTLRIVGDVAASSRFYGIYGAVELDKNGIPIGQIVAKPGVTWDGGEVEAPDVRYSMATVNDGGPPVSSTRQSVRVYEWRDGVTVEILRVPGAITIRDGAPVSATVMASDKSRKYTTARDWIPVEGMWVCDARVESV